MPATDEVSHEVRIGLRFDPRQHTIIRIAQAGVANPDTARLLDMALKSIDSGEPLVVVAPTEETALKMADEFIRLGLKRPAVEYRGAEDRDLTKVGLDTPGG